MPTSAQRLSNGSVMARRRPILRGPTAWMRPRRTTNGYWRHPTVGAPAIVETEALAEPSLSRETLAHELEGVTRLGLQKIGQILRLPTDPHNGNVLRAQIGAAAT